MATDATNAGQTYVFASLPRCPQCEKSNYKIYRSSSNGDGTRLQYARCLTPNCEKRKFKIIWE